MPVSRHILHKDVCTYVYTSNKELKALYSTGLPFSGKFPDFKKIENPPVAAPYFLQFAKVTF